MPFEANNTMIYIRNITIRTAKSADYLGNVGKSHTYCQDVTMLQYRNMMG